MTGEVQLLVLGEDPQPGRPARQVHPGQERRLELAYFPRHLLHHSRRQVLRIQHHHQAVALQRAPAEDVNLPVAKVEHAHPHQAQGQSFPPGGPADKPSAGRPGKARTPARWPACIQAHYLVTGRGGAADRRVGIPPIGTALESELWARPGGA
jgi:hypothetical protein